MMERVREFLRHGAADFAGIAVFYLLLYTVGLKAAIAGTIVFLVIDVVRRHRLKLGFPRIYVLTSAMVLVFGLIDLFSDDPFMIKWEAVITSLVVAVMFAWGARGKSLLQQLVEQRQGEPFVDQPDVERFFQLLTLIWAGYFVLKAGIYAWMGEAMPMEQVLEWRPVIGTGSLVAMVVLMTQGRRLFALFRNWGWLPDGPGLDAE